MNGPTFEGSETPLKMRWLDRFPHIKDELGKIPRTGWVRRGVRNPESVLEHTVSLKELAIKICGELPEFNEKDKLDMLDMLELHDWPEAIIGDEVIVTKDQEEKARLKAAKFERERAAMKKICAELGEDGPEAFNLWLRFEERKEPVSIFARQLDIYQAMEKAFEYESQGEGSVSTLDFVDYADKDITHPIIRERMENLRKSVTEIRKTN